MKLLRTVIIITVILSLPYRASGMAVIDAALQGTTIFNQVTNVVHFIDTVYNTYEQAMNTYEQLKMAAEKAAAAAKHFSEIGSISNFDDFKQWHTAQLAMEQAAESSFANTKIKIGSNSVSIKNIQDLPDVIAKYGKANLVDIWGQEPTDEMKMRLWREFGVTPGNYAYVKAWEDREDELAKKMVETKAAEDKFREDRDKENKKTIDELIKGVEDDEVLKSKLLEIQASTALKSDDKLAMIQKLLSDANEAKALEAKSKKAVNESMPVGDGLTTVDDRYNSLFSKSK